MRVTERGAVMTTLVPPILLAATLLVKPTAVLAAVALTVISCVIGLVTTHNVYAGIILPVYQLSALLSLLMPNTVLLCVLAAGVGVFKVGVCMSVCLHRYAAHAAFHCHWATNLFLGALGCLANQGGPIWWASQHRTHHKFCDEERDPHSSLQTSVVSAFAFFSRDNLKDVEEEFAPKHCDTFGMRLIDTFSILPVMAEFVLSYYYFGAPGLFVAYTSGWLSQTLSLWFNVVNHPPSVPGKCKAADSVGSFKLPNLFFRLFSLFMWIGVVNGEGEHGHHHDHPQLAHRPGIDLPYHVFVNPLSSIGLIWNCKVKGR